MPPHLFVYGSLMPHLTVPFGRAERMRLAAEGAAIGTATIQGRLFNLGTHPGLIIAPDDPRAIAVHGVLLSLEAPDATFRWLDPFEDIERGRAVDLNFYARNLAAVRTDSGGDIEAWVYVMRRMPEKAPELSSGRWPAPCL